MKTEKRKGWLSVCLDVFVKWLPHDLIELIMFSFMISGAVNGLILNDKTNMHLCFIIVMLAWLKAGPRE